MAIPSAVEKMEQDAEAALKESGISLVGEEPIEESKETIVDETKDETLESKEVASISKEDPTPKSDDSEYWKHKFEVLNGKYLAEVPRQAEEIRSLRDMVEGLKEKSEKKDEIIPEETPGSLSEFKEQFPDIYDAMLTMVDERTGKYKSEIDELRQELGKTTTITANTAQEKFEEKLSSKVEDWRELNTDPKFLDWLQEKDNYSGYKKMDLLRNAYSEGNVDRVALFFDTFKEKGGVSLNPTKINDSSKDLKGIASPDQRSKNGAKEIVQKKVHTREDIKKLSDDMRTLMTQGKYEAAEKIEKQLDEIMASSMSRAK
jgi:hypothetical protein